MYFLIIVFKNRTDSITFLNIVKSYTKNAKIINTPQELQMPCGISISMPINNENIAIDILRRRHFSSFVGMYKMLQTNFSQKILPYNY